MVCHIPVPVDEVEYLIKQDENRRLCPRRRGFREPGSLGVRSLRLPPRAFTPSSPAIWRAMSIQGVSVPSLGSQAVPTKVATLTSSGTVAPVFLSRSWTPVRCWLRSCLPGRCGYRLVSVWVFPPPNWVMSESTGAALSVCPDSLLRTVPACSVRDWVKYVLEKNCSGSL